MSLTYFHLPGVKQLIGINVIEKVLEFVDLTNPMRQEAGWSHRGELWARSRKTG